MTARQWRWALVVMGICAGLANSGLMFAQGTPLTLGPLTVTPPPGWVAQTNVVPVRLFSPDSTPQAFFLVEFLPFEQTSQDVAEHHSQLWARLTGTLRALSQPQIGVAGQFIWTRVDAQRGPGQTDTLILYSAKSGTTYMAITVDATRNDLLSRNLSALEAMLGNAQLSGASGPPVSSVAPNSAGASAAAPTGGAALDSLGDYVYETPPGWTATQYPDGMVLMSPTSATNERCVVTLWPMRAAGANLLADADSVFRDVYRTYELRNQTVRDTPMPPSIARGTSGQGWDYVIVRKGIAPPGSPESRLGFVLVARLNNRLAVISGVSRDPLISTCFGEYAGSAWPRFFYSLSFKSWAPQDRGSEVRKKMVGVWTSATATGGGQFTFAANGRYADAAARQQYDRISNSEVLVTTQGFTGNGAYSVKGNSITLTPNNERPERGFIRVEEESKDDGRSWIDSLYLLRVSPVDGKDYEVRYYKK